MTDENNTPTTVLFLHIDETCAPWWWRWFALEHDAATPWLDKHDPALRMVECLNVDWMDNLPI